jgi:predicted TIM-barrel fold metal-dependent hydrolase
MCHPSQTGDTLETHTNKPTERRKMPNTHKSKIDIFPHIFPVKYKEALLKELPPDSYWQKSVTANPALYDMDSRFKIMDKFEGLVQVLTIAGPPIESVFSPKKAEGLTKMANDGMAELVVKYPDRFVAAVACLPMANIEAALKEADRAINDLGCKGIMIHTPINNKAMDLPEYMPIYEKMSQYDLPIWIHPFRPETYADYTTEHISKHRIYQRFGWPYETTTAMARLVFSGVLEKYPGLKFITHHCGGMIPFFASRTEPRSDVPKEQTEGTLMPLSRHPVEYFKMFYGDTSNINLAALTCGYDFFGTGHLVFGTDMPWGAQQGDFFNRQAINAIEQLKISEADKRAIFQGNARRLLHLPD